MSQVYGTTSVRKIERKKGRSTTQKIMIALLVIGILAGIGVAIYFIWLKKDDGAGDDGNGDGDGNGGTTGCSGTEPDCISPSGSDIVANCDGVQWNCPSGSCNVSNQFQCENTDGDEKESNCLDDG